MPTLASNPTPSLAALDPELWLASRLKDHGVFVGVTDRATRVKRFREAIAGAGLHEVIVGRNRSGKPETYSDFFARIFGEPL